jgi:hypothetical protein
MRRLWVSLTLVPFTLACNADGPAETDEGGAVDTAATDGVVAGDPSSTGSGALSGNAPSTSQGDSSNEEAPQDDGVAGDPDATRGAISLHVVPAGECAIGDTWVDFPSVTGGHPVNGSEHSALSVDSTRDEAGYAQNVACEWLTLEEPVSVVVGIRTLSDVDGGSAALNPSLIPGSTGLGTIQFQRNMTELDYGTYDPEALCQYTVIDLDVASATVWGSVTCPSLADQGEAEHCAVSEGYFYFENCRQRM